MENYYVGVLEAASDSGSAIVHAIFLTFNSVFLIYRIVFCTDKIGKRAKGIPRQNSGWGVRGQPLRIKIS